MPELKKSLRNGATFAVAALIAVGALAGCSPFSSESDVDKVKDTVTAVMTSNDPSVCTEKFTTQFLETASGKTGTGALEACQKKQPSAGSTAEAVRFVAVTIDGERATALITVKGGSLDGRTATAGLAKDGDWKVAALRASPRPPSPTKTRALADKALRDLLAQLPRFNKSKADCVIRYLRAHASNAQLADDLRILKAGKVPADFATAIRNCR